MRVRLSIVGVGLVLGLTHIGCTTFSSRDPNVTAEFSTPTAEDLFLVGKFNVKKNATKFLDENHFGEELDLSERRPAVNLRGTIFEQKYGRADSELYGNFYHQGRFYVVRVPSGAVKDVYFQLSYATPKVKGRHSAAHSLLRFELEKPLELIAPMPTPAELQNLVLPEAMTGEETLVRNVVISAEAQWTKRDKYKAYSLKRGKLGAFIQIVRFESMQTRFEEFYETGKPASQIRFQPKDQASGDAILREALRTSQKDGIGKLYDTFWYDCTTQAFEIVERAEGLKDDRLGFIRSFMQKRIPAIAPEKLEQYGGLEVLPIAHDPSLVEESAEAFEDEIAMPKRELCPDDFETPNCENVKGAVAFLKQAGRI